MPCKGEVAPGLRMEHGPRDMASSTAQNTVSTGRAAFQIHAPVPVDEFQLTARTKPL